MATVLVTFPADTAQRKAFMDRLGHLGSVIFLSEVLAENRLRTLSAADVVVSWSLERELQPSEFQALTNLKLLQLISAGVDHIPFTVIPPTVAIAGNAGAYADQMAEHILAMILAVYKNLADRHDKLVNGIYDHESENRTLRGSICAILGFGGIGKATARLLRCFGVGILAINTSGRTEEHVEFIGTLKDIEHVLRLADIIVIALPLTHSTRGLIGERELGWMKNNATLVNVARADIVEEEALFEKLKNYPSFNAAIDTWWVEPFSGGKFHTAHPFLTLPNVLGSPHNSGLVPMAMVTAAAYAAENVRRFIDHEPLRGVITRSDYT